MSHCINILTPSVNPTMEVSVRTVKNDKMDIQVVYQHYAIDSVEDFRGVCKAAINGSAGKKETKARFIRSLDGTQSKARMLKIVNDFWLAGVGLKV